MKTLFVKFRDYIYAAVAIACVVFYNVHVHNLIVAAENKQTIALSKQSDKLKGEAHAAVVAQTTDYERKLHDADAKRVQDLYDAGVAHNADVRRLLARANAYSDENGKLRSAIAAAGEQRSGEGPAGVDGVGQLPEFARVSVNLADALRFDDGLLAACRAERAALTGK